MKSILYSLSLTCLLCYSVYSQEEYPFTCINNEDLLTLAGWALYTDQYGSTIDAQAFFRDTAFVCIDYKVTQMPSENEFPWIEADCYLPDMSSLETLKGVRIKYRSDQSILVALSQFPLFNYGESYQKSLPASPKWTTTNIPLTAFAQPDWSEHKDIPLKVHEIISVSITPDVNNLSAGVSGYIHIKELKLCGPKINLSNTDLVVKSYSLTNNHLHLLLSRTDKYNINVISPVSGTIFSAVGMELTQGFNKVDLKRPIAKGEYIIEVSTTNTMFMKKTHVITFERGIRSVDR